MSYNMHTAEIEVGTGIHIYVWPSSAAPKVAIEIVEMGKNLMAYLTAEQTDTLIRNLAVARVALGASK